jgi:2-methylcitrate dehydratase
MKKRSPRSNVRPKPDSLFVEIADYVMDFEPSAAALEAARLCLTDTLAGALDALDFPACRRFVEPVMPGASAAGAARVPGTRYELDPIAATFSFGCMVRWLDYNDQFSGAQGSHPSDNLAGVLMLADYLSRSAAAKDRAPLLMRDVLAALVKTYEIQGGIALENNLEDGAVDHNLLARVASTAVLARMLGCSREQIIGAVSNAFIDCSLVVYRHSPNTGTRKNWACAAANADALRLAYIAARGDPGYPSALTETYFGLYDARFGGKPFRFSRPFGDYIIQNSMFKLVPAGMHAQSAVECAFRLHPLVRDRLEDIERVEVRSDAYLLNFMDRTGPLYNPSDRDHCAQYVLAVGLIHGRLTPLDFDDEFAADPRIDRLRERMTLIEEPRYNESYFDPARRTSANAVRVWFRDGSSTPQVEIEYPLGHPRRRAEALPALRAKFESSLARRFDAGRRAKLLHLCDDVAEFARTPVHRFTDLLVADLPSAAI